MKFEQPELDPILLEIVHNALRSVTDENLHHFDEKRVFHQHQRAA